MENQYSTPEPENVAPHKKGFVQNFDGKIEGVLQKIDNGNIFKTIIDFVFQAVAWLFLIFGAYSAVINIFGDEGYFSNFKYLESGEKFTAVIGFLLGLLVCLLVIYVVFSILRNRSEKLKSESYDGILNYIFRKTCPALLVTFGEVLSVLLLTVGLLLVFANLLGSMVYFPLTDILNSMSEVLDLGIGGDTQIFLEGNWDYFSEGMKMSIGIMIASSIVLIGTYVLREVYFYAYKLTVNLINFLPKLAIPLAIRKRSE